VLHDRPSGVRVSPRRRESCACRAKAIKDEAEADVERGGAVAGRRRERRRHARRRRIGPWGMPAKTSCTAVAVSAPSPNEKLDRERLDREVQVRQAR
jgi:hypothetical protein